ncbi:hypothetical protein A176_003445 [Myxococcus hansupus]|uniref:Uncharacterized protein n=1 Tax=Pseudomyxococcus hansupus TaxID=1297742 RepID=A0A0H4WY60_9BACT|nr:hypothetical protein A176_003445 [Myxococcus hansupus]
MAGASVAHASAALACLLAPEADVALQRAVTWRARRRLAACAS